MLCDRTRRTKSSISCCCRDDEPLNIKKTSFNRTKKWEWMQIGWSRKNMKLLFERSNESFVAKTRTEFYRENSKILDSCTKFMCIDATNPCFLLEFFQSQHSLPLLFPWNMFVVFNIATTPTDSINHCTTYWITYLN